MAKVPSITEIFSALVQKERIGRPAASAESKGANEPALIDKTTPELSTDRAEALVRTSSLKVKQDAQVAVEAQQLEEARVMQLLSED